MAYMDTVFLETSSEVQLHCAVSCQGCNSQHLTQLLQLDCFHVFCKPCLETILNYPRPKAPFNCPRCGGFCMVPEKGIEDIPNEPMTESIHHAFKSVLTNFKTDCVACSETNTNSESVGICLNCSSHFCNEHGTHHLEKTRHDFFLYGEFDISTKIAQKLVLKSDICPYHKLGENSYCSTCGDVICNECASTKHEGHNYGTVEDIAGKYKIKLKENLLKVQQDRGQALVKMQQLQNKKDTIRNGEGVAREILLQESVGPPDENLRTKLERLEVENNSMSSKLDYRMNEVKKKITKQSGAIEYLELFLRNASDSVVLKKYEEYNSRLNTLIKVHGDTPAEDPSKINRMVNPKHSPRAVKDSRNRQESESETSVGWSSYQSSLGEIDRTSEWVRNNNVGGEVESSIGQTSEWSHTASPGEDAYHVTSWKTSEGQRSIGYPSRMNRNRQESERETSVGWSSYQSSLGKIDRTSEWVRNNNVGGEVESSIGQTSEWSYHESEEEEKKKKRKSKAEERSARKSLNAEGNIIISATSSLASSKTSKTGSTARITMNKTVTGHKLEATHTLSYCTGVATYRGVFFAVQKTLVNIYSMDDPCQLKLEVLIDGNDVDVCNTNKEVFVSDFGQKAVVVFKLDGTLLRKYHLPERETRGQWCPLGIAVDKENSDIYLCSLTTNFVYKYDRQDLKFVTWIDNKGDPGPGPKYLCVAPGHNVVVSYLHDDCVIQYNSQGTPVWKFGCDKELSNPKGVCADSLGCVFIADSLHKRIVQVSEKGFFLTAITAIFKGDPIALSFDNERLVITTDQEISVIKCYYFRL